MDLNSGYTSNDDWAIWQTTTGPNYDDTTITGGLCDVAIAAVATEIEDMPDEPKYFHHSTPFLRQPTCVIPQIECMQLKQNRTRGKMSPRRGAVY